MSSWRRALYACVRPGGIFIDGGANVGRVTQCASYLVGSDGRVHSFEPSLSIRRLLLSRIENLGLTNVTVRSEALGRKRGVAPFYEYAEHKGGSSSLVPYGNRLGSREPYPVDLIDLDSYISSVDIDSVDFVKLDVEGAELDAITGARKTLRAHFPTLLVEFSPENTTRFGYDLDDLLAYLLDLEYQPFVVDSNGLRRLKDPNSFEQHERLDILFTHRANRPDIRV